VRDLSSLRPALLEALNRLARRLSDAVWAPTASPVIRERRTKLVMVSGVGLFAVALMILLLFVLPAMQVAGTPSEAQPPSQMPGAPGAGPPAPAPSAPAPPGMAPGAPGMPGMPEMPGMPGAAAPAAPAAPAGPAQPTLGCRENPFAPVGAEAVVAAKKEYRTAATKYGPDWSRLPVTLREGFVRPQRPPHPSPAPTPEEIETLAAGAGALFRISSILWTAGAPLATYETPSGETGTIGPGDVVKGWRVTEIGRNYVIVQEVKSDRTQRLPLKTEH